jgi:hypothetical protein
MSGGMGILHGLGHTAGDHYGQADNVDESFCEKLFGIKEGNLGRPEVQPGIPGYFQPAVALTAAAAVGLTAYAIYRRAPGQRSSAPVANPALQQTQIGNVPGLPGLPVSRV